MAGIYLHIPFCKKACHYCDFHFSISLQLKGPLLAALSTEIISRKNELDDEKIDTIYFGGGTPSLLEVDEIKAIIDTVFSNYPVDPDAEITLEANPDDLTNSKIRDLRTTPINRFSIGVQSFFDEDLLYMNRVHTAQESERAIKSSQDAGFENLTIDLIYGTPTLTEENWIANLRKIVSFSVPHVSCYALTVEEKTPLAGLIKSKKRALVDDQKIADHFRILAETLPQYGFEQYELSNFAKQGYRSKHNSSYWGGKAYLGVGPSAHSYNGKDKRRWNVSNNAEYIRKINQQALYFEEEMLTQRDRFNEYMMTRIRLIEGISLEEINSVFGPDHVKHINTIVESWDPEWYAVQSNSIRLNNPGKILSDRLASQLFLSKNVEF
jgi:oxygen-independent coproporphyrinogen-3 oxidase